MAVAEPEFFKHHDNGTAVRLHATDGGRVMSALARYLTHPGVVIDPDIDPAQWKISPRGRERLFRVIGAGWLEATRRIVCGPDRCSLETATPIAKSLGCELDVREEMHEIDCSQGKFLAPESYQAALDQFFARPGVGIEGRESASQAQARIAGAVEAALGAHDAGDILFVGRWSIGTLLFCHIAGKPISRRFDQQAGGGCVFAFDARERSLLHGWKRMEDLDGVTPREAPAPG